MFEGIKLWATNRKIRLMEAKLDLQLLEAAYSDYILQDPDEADWQLLGGTADIYNLLSEEGVQLNLDLLRKKCQALYLRHPNAHGIIENIVNYVVGDGMVYEAVGEEKDLVDRVNKAWQSWCDVNLWPLREEEVVKRLAMDGECFLRFFDGNSVRFVEPADVTNPPDAPDNTLYGIQCRPGDAETRLFYFIKKPDARGQDVGVFEKVEAKNIIHLRFGVNLNSRRGLPLLFSVADRLRQYDQWLKDRLVLNRARTNIVMIRRHINATPAQIRQFAEANKTGDKKVKEGNARYKRMRGGTTIDTGGDVEYDFKSPNVDARDVAADGRAVLLSCAAGATLAEFMVTADASNANYSSTMIAEGPPVRFFSRLQKLVIKGCFEQVWKRVTDLEIGKGMELDATHEVTGKVVPPRLVKRDRTVDTAADEKCFVQGVMSKTTWRQREGLDSEEEDRLISIEEESSDDEPNQHAAVDDLGKAKGATENGIGEFKPDGQKKEGLPGETLLSLDTEK